MKETFYRNKFDRYQKVGSQQNWHSIKAILYDYNVNNINITSWETDATGKGIITEFTLEKKD